MKTVIRFGVDPMKCLALLAVAVSAVASSCSVITVEAPSHDTPVGPVLGSQARARQVLERTLDALGRREVIQFENLGGRYKAVGLARGQSYRPGPPFDSIASTGLFYYEDRGRLYHEAQSSNVGGTDRSFRRALLDEHSWHYWIPRKLLTSMEPSDVALFRARANLNMEKALPASLIRAALRAPESLRWLGVDHESGLPMARLAYSEKDGGDATLGIDTVTWLPRVVERLGSDRLTGDAVHGVRFEDYAAVNGLLLPHRLVFTLDGMPVRRWSLFDLEVNQPADEGRFSPPEGIDAAEHPPRFQPVRVADGIYVVRLYSGPANSYNTLLVEFADHVVVLEAPLVGALYPVIVNAADAIAPGKPIRSVVTTHHHHDHSGGAARFLAAGVDVIAPPHAVAVVSRMVEAAQTVAGGPTGSGEPGRLIAVEDSLILSDGTRTLRLIQVGSTPHVEQILVGHIPQDRVLYVADLFAVPETRVFPPASPTMKSFARLVEQFDLGFETVVPTHGLVGAPADLEAALAVAAGPVQEPYESIQIRVGELVFDALAAGPTDGELVILLHGFPQTSFTWRNQIPQLAEAGFRVVAPDQRGYSPGARPDAVEYYAMGHLAEDVTGIADALGGEQFHLVGHDWGGAVAWVTALRNPDRVKSLVAVSTPHPAAFGRALAQPGSDQARRSSYFGDFAAADAADRFLDNDSALLRQLFGGAVLSSEEIEVYISALRSHEAMNSALNWYRALQTARGGGGGAAQASASPPPFEVPTVYIWGTEDSAFGREAASATGEFVAGYYQFEVFEGVGHWVQEQRPDRVTNLILAHLARFRSK